MAAGLLLILAIYSLGWSGTLHFDDKANLDGLYGVSDLRSGLEFVLSGDSGPTGRPLSLATFALQSEAWPDPKPFLIFNTLLHLLNGLLCFLLLRRLLGWMRPDTRSAEWLAVIVALTWVASPFLASSNLMVVQRMTGLSAFFALLALNVYTMARTGYRPDSWRSNLWLASIAGAGTLLAGLAKENGFLLPVFLLLIEWLLVAEARLKIRPLHKGFFCVVLVTPVAVILGALLHRGLSSAEYLYRDYTLVERLLTQPRVLFDYIVNLLIPSTESITPFHDAYAHSTGLLTPATTVLSIIGLLGLIALAWIVRARWPIVTFGVLFFLAGHLVESTVVPLELYFPHRNYLPAIGLYLAVLVLAAKGLGRLDFGFPMHKIALATYCVLFAGILLSGTMLWGNRQLSAEMWYLYKKESVRAAIYLFRFYIDRDELDVAATLNERFISQYPAVAIFPLQSLSICNEDRKIYKRKLDRAISILAQQPQISVNVVRILQQFSANAKDSGCSALGVERADELISVAMKRANQTLTHPNAMRGLLFAQAQLEDHRGNYRKAIDSLQQSMEIEPTLDAALLIAYFYVEMGELLSAINHLEHIASDPPVGFPHIIVWRSRLEVLLATLRQELMVP